MFKKSFEAAEPSLALPSYCMLTHCLAFYKLLLQTHQYFDELKQPNTWS